MGVAVCWAAEDDDGLLREEAGRFGGDSGFPSSTGHGGCFGGGDDDDELPDAEGLDIDNVGGPGVGLIHFTNVEEDGFRTLACFLFRGGDSEKSRDEFPQRVGIGLAGIALGEVKCTRPVGCTSCE